MSDPFRNAKKSADDILRHHGIETDGTKDEFYTLCPRCSENRKTPSHRRAKCLDVKIDEKGVQFYCRHCKWSGGAFYESKTAARIVAEYIYKNEQGQPHLKVARTAEKQFPQSHWTGSEWKSGAKGIIPLPYRLPELLASTGPIFVTEGEKDADRMTSLGFTATTNAMGAGKWRSDLNKWFEGRIVFVLPDNDAPGRDHAEQVARNLHGIAQEVRIVELPGLPPKGDVSDWLDADENGEGAFILLDLADCAPVWVPSREKRKEADCGLVSSRAADITPESVKWLWPGRLAIGKHTCVAGEPGTGKSQLSVDIIAALTTGGDWPCGEGRAPLGNVIILSAEDGAADTIVPRLMAVGADLTRVHIVSSVSEADGKGRRAFNLQTDIALLERKIAEVGDVVLIVVDPVSSYMGRTDSHKNSEVRGVLEPLSDMADRTRTAILTITHFSKAGAANTTKALHRFIGSIAFTGAPRAAFAVIDDAENEGRKLFLHAKNNLAAPPQGLAFRLEQTIVADNIVASRVTWDREPVTITANQALAADAAGTSGKTDKQEAIDLLNAALANGPMSAKEAERMAREHGIGSKALRSAREALKVKIDRDGFGPGSKSLWSLLEAPYLPSSPIHAQQSNRASMDAEGKYGASRPPPKPDDYPDLPDCLR
jgi:putative DNA primase/helicase